MNLVDLVKDQLTGQVLGSLGSLIGADESQTRSATSAAVPALLGGLTGQVPTPTQHVDSSRIFRIPYNAQDFIALLQREIKPATTKPRGIGELCRYQVAFQKIAFGVFEVELRHARNMQ